MIRTMRLGYTCVYTMHSKSTCGWEDAALDLNAGVSPTAQHELIMFSANGLYLLF